MPATEQTWRNQKLLHVVFAVSSLLMAIATVWLLASDHLKEWKKWQLADRKKDAWVLAARRDELAAQNAKAMAEFDAKLRLLDSEAIPANLLARFKAAVSAEDRRLSEASAAAADDGRVKATPVSTTAGAEDAQFARLDELASKLAELAAKAEELRGKALQTPAEGETPAATAEDVLAAEKAAGAMRDRLLAAMDRPFIREAKRREGRLVADKKSANGQRTAKVSELGIAIGEGKPEAVQREIQLDVDRLNRAIGKMTAEIAAAKDYRLSLEGIVAEADASQAALVKERDAIQTELARLDEQVYKNTSHIGEWVTRWPVLNALYNGNIRIDQNWLPDLTINYNFSQAARFDRCTSCHRAISKTAPGTATDPLYPTLPDADREFVVELATPGEAPSAEGEEDAAERLELAYGLKLSDRGIVTDGDVTVRYATPESLASRAGLQSGDVIEAVDGSPVYSPAEVADRLLNFVTWGQPAKVSVRRGLDHPFTGHPRLDLYLTDLSPHPQKDVGCTICHDGQGSGTSFAWTSHTPDNAKQQKDWIENRGWFDNHHWIFPMKPARFVESNCLKCHHEKGGLLPSERFPEPPAPKLVEGWSIVEEYGCFGCHDVNGFDGPARTVGPDLRLEPNYHEVAAAVLRDPGLSPAEQGWARDLIARPDDSDARTRLMTSIKSDVAADGADAPRLSATTLKLADGLKDVEVPGHYRKVGPSLRFVASKVDYAWLYSWIRKPADFRPSTKMPQFFGQYEHLTEADDAIELAHSLKFEPIEIRAITEYLLKSSSKFEYLEAPAEVTEEASADRGKVLFETRGCLACHAHSDHPDVKSHQGPNLSGLGDKLNTPDGAKWLYSWIKQPHRYHARTRMPVLYLDPIAEKDAQGKPTGKVTDPAADIAKYLLGQSADWKPQDVPKAGEWTEAEQAALLDLAVEWLRSDQIPEARARDYLFNGVPEAQAAKLKADEAMLVGINNDNRAERLSEFVARRTIGKYGCFGCHDVPGFEDAKPIGTGLVDWGRKESSKLAFENIHKFLETHGIHPPNATEEQKAQAAEAAAAALRRGAQPAAASEGPASQEAHAADAGGHESHQELDPGDFPDADNYFIQAINSHARDGFIWQKLRYPRTYDYKTTRNKTWNERTRMPRFPLSDEQREAVMTFVLGLVKEPPATKYLYKPIGAAKAIAEGRQVLERFNCAGCHTLKMEQWDFHFVPEEFESPSEVVDFPFLEPQYSSREIAESQAMDSRGMLHAEVFGLPVLDEETGEATWVDVDREPISQEELIEAEAEEGETIPVYYRFTPWRNALLNGEVRLRGVEELLIPADREKYGPANGVAHPAWGGDLARYLYPRVIARAKEVNPQVNGKEAWGWLPPPLMEEGKKVQPEWLHGFLMDPTAIRPAVVMRMPNFRMSSAEAAKLVNYFAATGGVEFPYEYKPQQRPSYLAERSGERKDPLGEAMQIVTNGNYCVKCHAVADFQPQGDVNTFGPNLAEVSRRLRPEYVRNWVANPARILPYTGMPVNIPYRPQEENLGGISQELFHGTSLDQLSGLVDLLMNFDAYARSQTSVTPLVEAAKQQTAAPQEDSESN
jgi:cytochrome c2